MNTIPLRTVCVGRLLVDLPKSGTLRWSQDFDRAKVSRLSVSLDTENEFWAVVERRRFELSVLPHETENSQLSLFQKIGNNGAIMLYRDSDTWTGGYSMDRYSWVTNRGYLLRSGPWPNEIKQEIPMYTEIFKAMSPVDNFIPINPTGFCIDGALVKGDVGQIDASVVVESLGWKGVAITLGTIEGNDAPGPGDLPPATLYDDLREAEDENERMKGSASGDVKAFKVLLKTDRPSGSIPGRATAYRVTFNNGRFKYRYHWEDSGTNPASSTHPGISIGLDFDDEGPNENPNIPPPREDQMLGLFNAVVDSVRLRPGAI